MAVADPGSQIREIGPAAGRPLAEAPNTPSFQRAVAAPGQQVADDSGGLVARQVAAEKLLEVRRFWMVICGRCLQGLSALRFEYRRIFV
jgi:hypothetical protein